MVFCFARGKGSVCWPCALLGSSGIQCAKASRKQGGILDVASASACLVAKDRALRDGATSLGRLARMLARERPTWRQPASWEDLPVSLQTEFTLGLWEEQEGYV